VETRNIHVGCGKGSIEPGQNVAQPACVLRNYPAHLIVLVKATQAFAPNRLDQN
jgi:hypothetical protein